MVRLFFNSYCWRLTTSFMQPLILPPAKTDRVELSVAPLQSLTTSVSPETRQQPRSSPRLHTSGRGVPEPLCSDIIISTQHDQLARRRNPAPRTIQIIDPRPLRSRRAQADPSEIPAALAPSHIRSSVSSDHDYCRPPDHSLTNISHHSRASDLQDICNGSDESPVVTCEPNAAAKCKHQTSTSEGDAFAIRDENDAARPAMLDLPAEPWTRSVRALSADRVLPLFDGTATEHRHAGAAEDKMVPRALPTPPPSPVVRGRDRGRCRGSSPYSDSSSCSSSCSSSSSSPSPKRQK